jgi:hypothetical protein
MSERGEEKRHVHAVESKSNWQSTSLSAIIAEIVGRSIGKKYVEGVERR